MPEEKLFMRKHDVFWMCFGQSGKVAKKILREFFEIRLCSLFLGWIKMMSCALFFTKTKIFC